jgi:hypothetical protein
MTIILGYTNHLFSVLVADRVTTVGGKLGNTHANKVVVGRFTDGWLTVGYTGIAMIGQTPTDDWLVSLAVPSVVGRSGVSMRAHADIPQTMDAFIGRLIVGLRQRLQDTPSLVRAPLEIGIVGVRFRRNMVWPFLLTLEKRAHSRVFQQVLRSRRGQSDVQFCDLWVSGGWGRAKPEAHASIKQQVGIIDPRLELAPEIIAEMLRSGALAFGAGEPGIGSELCTVIHAPFGGGSVIDFHPIAPHALVGALANVVGSQPITYAPWVFGHQTVASPIAVSGTVTMNVGGHPIEIRGEANPDFFALVPDSPLQSAPRLDDKM